MAASIDDAVAEITARQRLSTAANEMWIRRAPCGAGTRTSACTFARAIARLGGATYASTCMGCTHVCIGCAGASYGINSARACPGISAGFPVSA